MGKLIEISGASDSRIAPIAAKILNEKNASGLFIVSSAVRAARLAQDLSFFVSDDTGIYVMPEENEIYATYEAKNRDRLFDRLTAVNALLSDEKSVVIAPVSAALKKMMPHGEFQKGSIKLSVGENITPGDIKEKLVLLGYERLPLVEERGQFSLRGDILDVFTPEADNPFRIEFFDTEVDSIRSFDLISQRSLENLKCVDIGAASQLLKDEEMFKKAAHNIESAYDKAIEKAADEMKQRLQERKARMLDYIDEGINVQFLENYVHYFYEQSEFIWDYADVNTAVFIDDPDRIGEHIEARSRELMSDFEALIEKGMAVPKDIKAFAGENEFKRLFDGAFDCRIFTPFTQKIKYTDRLDERTEVVCKQTPTFGGRMDYLETELKSYVKAGYDVTISASNAERAENLSEFADRVGLLGKIRIKTGTLTAGMEFPEEKMCIISDADIFPSLKTSRKKKQKKKNGQLISSFTDLKPGDFVVHENHGIGKFLGIEKLSVQDITKDYIKIKYAGADMLYVPVEQMDIVQKYVGSEGVVPKINKLSGGDWKKTKARAKAAIASMAKEIVEMSAKRKIRGGYAFSKDSVWQKEFEDSFIYAETEDQLRCIEEIKADMEKPEAMDRLLCGDVGFGKTEVAARAIFKCLSDGKQAAILVPTTILAKQHYNTLKERFEAFPFTVGMLSRFRSEKEQEETVDALKKGNVDLVIGTHRLLSEDISFKNLGLLVIDEEQRFGVAHKEKIKALKENVDVLTLSATPIPRTLNMSLLGIKNMSVIEEPPEDRYPVQTYVMERDDAVIRDAIEKEMARGGQAFVLYNRVNGISRIAASIEKLVPQARVMTAHGRMSGENLENVMERFIDGEGDVLVATTIIESGIDIPNVNTIIIMDADRYGLSQLYQLRGRVGRSNKLAYAYLMYMRDKTLTELAEKRLRAIRDFTEFGAGFKVAMRDLEIRGAGNILGMEQSGHMNEIGYELYCKLVDDAIRALGGEVVNPDREEALIELPATAYIPDYYIHDEMTKLAMYKKIALVDSTEAEEDLTDELIDRFGDIPYETAELIKISRVRSLAEKLCITRVYMDSGKIVFTFGANNSLKASVLSEAFARFGQRLTIYGGTKPCLKYLPKNDSLSETIEVLEAIC